MRSIRALACVTFVLCIAVFAPAQAQDEITELTAMLQEFLANADKRDAHERFWADDLVYSSSSGLRSCLLSVGSGDVNG